MALKLSAKTLELLKSSIRARASSSNRYRVLSTLASESRQTIATPKPGRGILQLDAQDETIVLGVMR